MKEIVKNLEEAPSNIFQESCKHIQKVMRADPYRRFVSSPFFEKMVLFDYGEGNVDDGDVTLLLRSPERFEYFLQFLREELSPDKIEFCIAVDLFKVSQVNNSNNLQQEAKTLWNDFFDPEKRVYQLNLPKRVAEVISKQIVSSAANERTFDVARQLVAQTFEQNLLEKFKKSKFLINLCFSDDVSRSSKSIQVPPPLNPVSDINEDDLSQTQSENLSVGLNDDKTGETKVVKFSTNSPVTIRVDNLRDSLNSSNELEKN